MKPLISRFILVAMAWMILGSATPAKNAHVPAAKTPDDAWYYWYWTDDDSFLFYESVSDAIYDLENMTARLVNTQSIGGTLIAKAYDNTNQPHTSPVWVTLYKH